MTVIDAEGRRLWDRMSRADARQLANLLLSVDDSTDRIQVVYTAADLPDPDASGMRQLADSTLYSVRGVIDLEDTYVRSGSGSSMVGISPGPCQLNNTRSDYLIRGSMGVRNLQLIASNGVAYYADTASTAFLGNVVITSSSTAVEVVDCSRLLVDRLFSGGNGRGIIISGNCPSGQILKVQGGFGAADNFRGVEIESTATVGPMVMQDNQWTLSGATHAAFEFADDATYSTTATIRVVETNLVLSGGAVAIAGTVQKTDPRFSFSENAEIVDSASMGSMGFSGNTSQNTTVTTQDTFVPIGTGNGSHPVFTLATESERFELTGTLPNQRLRYIGLEPITVVAQYGVTTERIGSGTDEHLVRLVRGDDGGDTPVDGSEGSAEANAQAVSTSRSVPMTLQPQDTIGIEVTNSTDTDNIRVRSARLTVSRVR